MVDEHAPRVRTVPLPQARPRPAGLAFLKPQLVESIAIDVAMTDAGFRYAAVSELESWSGVVAAPNAEVAVLDAMIEIYATHLKGQRIRFVVGLGKASRLWAFTNQIATAATDWWIARPSTSDRSLVESVVAQLESARRSPEPPADLVPIAVATDGSVRGRYAGFGWLASSGDYGIGGYRSSSERVGTAAVLVAELCAIDSAVGGSPRHRLTVVSDSRAAVVLVNRWKRGEFVVPRGYPLVESGSVWDLTRIQRRIYVERERISLRWSRGHCGEPLNEGADALARLGARYPRGDRDLDEDEYRRRAAGIAQGFAAEFRRVNQARVVEC